ncbi:MAG: hypothetical protein ABIO80_05685 [Sphingomicrobium sp.]
MSRRGFKAKEMEIEEFGAWMAASDRIEQVGELTGEDGGPTLSLVPVPEQNDAWPTDLLAPAEQAGEPDAPEHDATPPGADAASAGDESAGEPTDGAAPLAARPFDGVALPDSRNRLAGWSADRQRVFLGHLAETGSVHIAANGARLSARGAYRLRTRSPAFARAWDSALQLAVGRLSAIAFDRAIHGRVEQIYHEGSLVGERRVPNDRLLTWLLARLDPQRFALPWEQRGDSDPQADAVAGFEGRLDALTDVPA